MSGDESATTDLVNEILREYSLTLHNYLNSNRALLYYATALGLRAGSHSFGGASLINLHSGTYTFIYSIVLAVSIHTCLYCSYTVVSATTHE